MNKSRGHQNRGGLPAWWLVGSATNPHRKKTGYYDIKSRINSRNAWYNLVQNLLLPN
jgi:hypothetical protein